MKYFRGFLIIFIFVFYYFFAEYQISEHHKLIQNQEQYVKDHNCKLVQMILERRVGMMWHGETDVYQCPNETIIYVN
jgi:hypothetical protein